MSHDQDQLPPQESPDTAVVAQGYAQSPSLSTPAHRHSPSSGHPPPVSAPSFSSDSGSTLSPALSPTSPYPHSVAGTSAVPRDDTMNDTRHGRAMTDSSALTALERWAANATSSQFNAFAGAVGGFTSGVVVCPLDVIKTKLQAQGGFAAVQKGRHVGHHRVYRGLVGTGKVIWREEGIRGMYRGLGPIILGYLPTWAVWFTVYNKSKEYLTERSRRFLRLLDYLESELSRHEFADEINQITSLQITLSSSTSGLPS